MSGGTRVGIVIPDTTVPAWQAKAIERLCAEDGLSVVGLIIDRARQEPSLARNPLSAAFVALDRTLHRGLARLSSPTAVSRDGVPVVELEASDRRAAGWRGVRDLGADVLVRLDDGEARDLAGAAAHGVWSLRIGAPAASVGLKEQTDSAEVLAARIVSMDRDGRSHLRHEALFAVHDYSLQRTLAPVYGSVPSLFIKALRDLRLDENRPVMAARHPFAGYEPTLALEAAMIPAFARYGARIARKVADWSMFDIYHWTVAVAPRVEGIDAPEALRGSTFRPIEQPADRFYADPFLFEHDGCEWLFLEIYPYRLGRGYLAAAKLDAEGRPGPFIPILERDYHLSYPFIFRWNGGIYLIPESVERHTIDLYRCERFPDRWVLERTLLEDVSALDSTVVERDGRLWLFSGMSSGWPAEIELHVFHADDVRGPWHPHPANPVVSDITRVRPAGRLFVDSKGRLIRPAQDSSIRYGRALSFSEITQLTTQTYEERRIAHVGPGELPWRPDAIGTHTFNAGARFLVADACVSRFRGERWLDAALARR